MTDPPVSCGKKLFGAILAALTTLALGVRGTLLLLALAVGLLAMDETRTRYDRWARPRKYRREWRAMSSAEIRYELADSAHWLGFSNTPEGGAFMVRFEHEAPRALLAEWDAIEMGLKKARPTSPGDFATVLLYARTALEVLAERPYTSTPCRTDLGR